VAAPHVPLMLSATEEIVAPASHVKPRTRQFPEPVAFGNGSLKAFPLLPRVYGLPPPPTCWTICDGTEPVERFRISTTQLTEATAVPVVVTLVEAQLETPPSVSCP